MAFIFARQPMEGTLRPPKTAGGAARRVNMASIQGPRPPSWNRSTAPAAAHWRYGGGPSAIDERPLRPSGKRRSHLSISRVCCATFFVTGGAPMSGQLKYVLDETKSLSPGTISLPICRCRRRRCCIRGPGSRSGRRPRAPFSDGDDPPRSFDRTLDRDSRARARHLSHVAAVAALSRAPS